MKSDRFSWRMWAMHWDMHSPRFVEIWTTIDVPRRIPIFLAQGDSFPTAWPRRAALRRGSPRPVLPSRGPATPSGLIGTAPGRNGGSLDQEVPIVERKLDGDSAL